VSTPPGGFWRVAKLIGPVVPSPRLTWAEQRERYGSGNRFDSAFGSFRVTHFGSSLEACLGETLARFRPEPEVVAQIADEWRDLGFMEVGAIARSWRDERVAVLAQPDGSAVSRWPEPFVDIDSAESHQVLRESLAGPLKQLGYDDLDAGIVRGPDRFITRILSEWVWGQREEDGRPLFGGLRYASRLSTDWECWAVFDRIPVVEIRRVPITLDLTELASVAWLFGLSVF
jgi:hypothetical protein